MFLLEILIFHGLAKALCGHWINRNIKTHSLAETLCTIPCKGVKFWAKLVLKLVFPLAHASKFRGFDVWNDYPPVHDIATDISLWTMTTHLLSWWILWCHVRLPTGRHETTKELGTCLMTLEPWNWDHKSPRSLKVSSLLWFLKRKKPSNHTKLKFLGYIVCLFGSLLEFVTPRDDSNFGNYFPSLIPIPCLWWARSNDGFHFDTLFHGGSW